ncbi:MAG: uroporphyrinogen-III synthase [Betaproteobacteria bacterium]|nr:MAG: uroporphyrinogen-III synthase [Betaproteobacteria bacterium]
MGVAPARDSKLGRHAHEPGRTRRSPSQARRLDHRLHFGGGGDLRSHHAGALLLKSKTVAILESRLGRQLADLVEKRGGRPLLAPALAEVPDIDHAGIARLIGELESRPPKAAIFQTGVGTQALFAATDSLGLTPKLLGLLASCVVVARGPKPTGALRSREVRIDRSAKEPYTTVEVLQSLEDLSFRGESVVVQRYGESNVALEKALRAKGAEVVEIPTYRWPLPEDSGPLAGLIDALDRAQVDATVFTSASQAHNLFALAQKLGRDGPLAANLSRTLVASIGPVCSAALREHGVKIALEAKPPKLGPLVAALARALSA